MTRAFVAVKLPDAVLDAVAGRIAGLALTGARPSTRGQLHLTLQFLGDHADVEAVVAALTDLHEPGGRVRLGGGGAFPAPRRGRVLWLGLVEGAAVITRLARAVGGRMTPLGHEPDTRPFHPHVTLARAKAVTDLRAPIATLGEEPVGHAWDVHALTVYESELRREGARYIERATVDLRA